MTAKTRRASFKQSGHYTLMHRHLVDEPAWRAISPKSQSLYVFLKLEWKGPKFNNNGEIRLSVRQAAEKMGITINTAASAFHELQAKGFIVVKERAALGVQGQAKAPAYEITELSMPYADRPTGRELYKKWKPGHDFEVIKHQANNPKGINKARRIPTQNLRRTCHKSDDEKLFPVSHSKTARH